MCAGTEILFELDLTLYIVAGLCIHVEPDSLLGVLDIAPRSCQAILVETKIAEIPAPDFDAAAYGHVRGKGHGTEAHECHYC